MRLKTKWSTHQLYVSTCALLAPVELIVYCRLYLAVETQHFSKYTPIIKHGELGNPFFKYEFKREEIREYIYRILRETWVP